MKVKKIAVIAILLVMLVVLSGCVKTVDPTGVERKVSYGLVTVAKVSGDGEFEVCYDPSTMICYMKICALYRLAISPYYIIGTNGEPELAIYGHNYFGDR